MNDTTTTTIVYLNGSFLPETEAVISPADRGFLLADGVYEVVRSYQGCLFQAASHWRRLQRCLAELSIIVTGGVEEDTYWHSIAEQLIQKNDLANADAYVYLQVTRGAAPHRSHYFPRDSSGNLLLQDLKPTVYGFASRSKNVSHLQKSGCRVITAPDHRWLRCDIKSIALLPNVLAKEAAKKAGAFESILVREESGNITEGSSTCFAIVLPDNRLVTAPPSNLVLPSITREVILELCGQLGISVVEEFIPLDSVHDAVEAMILSTTSEVMPVASIDGKPVGDGTGPGPVTKRLQEAYRQLVAHSCAASSSHEESR